MRILFDSKKSQYKTPFGTLCPNAPCTLHIQVPLHCQTLRIELVMQQEDGTELFRVPMVRQSAENNYECYTCTFRLEQGGLYFYYFDFFTKESDFPLYKQGDDTNIWKGDLWQVSCIPAQYPVPEAAKGAVMYQLFPDRYYRSGVCDLSGKLTPYRIHEDWYEMPDYLPDARGEIRNCDFFGGNLRGITEKLSDIQSLGVEYLYLNPIFMAYSNHRYDTCDYKRVDPMLGTEADFAALCRAAHDRGMKVILDGVFSHTGSDSIYFDANHRFGGGALEGKASPYYSWYDFKQFPEQYTCWWGIRTLPCVKKLEPGFVDYIITGQDSVIAHWLRLGADGFRLDVVDELPTAFLRILRQRLRELKPDALLIGEVWEDASNKIAYDVRRSYFTANELDSVMNYPWRTAILRYCAGLDDGTFLRSTIETITENYPPNALLCVMNSISTHDTARALTQLADPFRGTRAQKAERHLSPAARQRGLRMLRMAMALQFVLPGMPCIYYGDEAGMEGYEDPFNRACYPWGREDTALKQFVSNLGTLRRDNPVLRLGTVEVQSAGGGLIQILRCLDGTRVCLTCNRSDRAIPVFGAHLLLGGLLESVGADCITLSPGGFAIWEPTE